MNEKKIKEAMKQYIETETIKILSESEEKHDLSSLDEKVYATIVENKVKPKASAVLSFRKISAIAAAFVLIIGLSVAAVFILNKKPIETTHDEYYSIIISYENTQYRYFSNKVIIDKYGIQDVLNLEQDSDLFTGVLTNDDVIYADSDIDKDSIIGALIYPYSDKVIILQNNGQFYYFEKAANQ